jgi:hypothetical protein
MTRSFDQNPLKMGIPAMERHPKSIVVAVIFIFLKSPPMSLMSSVPHPWMTEPEPMNRRALKNAWFTMWKHPAKNPSTPSSSYPSAQRYPPAPSERIMYPSWETVE